MRKVKENIGFSGLSRKDLPNELGSSSIVQKAFEDVIKAGFQDVIPLNNEQGIIVTDDNWEIVDETQQITDY